MAAWQVGVKVPGPRAQQEGVRGRGRGRKAGQLSTTSTTWGGVGRRGSTGRETGGREAGVTDDVV